MTSLHLRRPFRKAAALTGWGGGQDGPDPRGYMGPDLPSSLFSQKSYSAETGDLKLIREVA